MAIYTRLTEEDIHDLLSRYDIGKLVSFKGIADGITNTNYLIETDRDRYILTLFEKRFELKDLPYFVALMEWWRERGIPCPQPIHMKDGRALGAIKEKPALMVSFLEGVPARGITPLHMAQLGRLTASMHVAGIDFPHA